MTASVSSSSASVTPVLAAAAAKELTPGMVSTSTCGTSSRTTRARWPKVEKVEASPSTRKTRSRPAASSSTVCAAARAHALVRISGSRVIGKISCSASSGMASPPRATIDSAYEVSSAFLTGYSQRAPDCSDRPGAAGDQFGVAGAERGADQPAVAVRGGHSSSFVAGIGWIQPDLAGHGRSLSGGHPCSWVAVTIHTGFCAASRCMSRIGWLRLAWSCTTSQAAAAAASAAWRWRGFPG
jgi:hypothetical protein